MTYFHPAWLEHQRKRYLRADAYRFAAPGTPEAKMPGWLDPSATRVRWKEAQEQEARRRAQAAEEEFERKLLQLHCEIKTLLLEHELWLFEEKYSPNQPRVPAGSPQGGQWTRIGGGQTGAGADSGDAVAADTQAESGSGEVLSDASPDDPVRAGDQFAKVIPICMLGSRSITLDRWNNVGDWWADYTCADGYTFRKFGFGGKIKPFLLDPR